MNHFLINEYDSNGKSKDKQISREEAGHIESVNLIKKKILKKILTKCKELVSSIRYSELTRLLKQKQESFNLNYPIKLVKAVPTRWNSTYDMLDSILVKKDELLLVVKILLSNKIYITEVEFVFLSELYNLLKPLKDLMNF
ncbi:unnamed protein product [Brachionus calyciflorus]|uniref:Uncharacterized protein n=1 Tax=Brachionus calyciflorus TaxID=104777 RepID=A0A814LG24_9BILA|nr:unnamed protein product [Brachionus calyciflorus]